MKTFDLKRSDREKKADQERMNSPPMVTMDAEDYPYGQRFSLEGEAIKKVGLDPDRLPARGTKFNLEGGAHVVGSNSSDGMFGNSERRLELMIHRLGLERDGEPEKEKSIRDELEDARHLARGTTATEGRIGARAATEAEC